MRAAAALCAAAATRASAANWTCADGAACTAPCAACCHSYITAGANCDNCVTSQCPAPGPAPAPGACGLQQGRNDNGPNLPGMPLKNATSADACCAACGGDAACAGFVWTGGDNDKQCYLKSAIVGPYADQWSAVGTVPGRGPTPAPPLPPATPAPPAPPTPPGPPPAPSQCTVTVSANDDGDNMRKLGGVTDAAACCTACTNEPACQGFVFNYNTCYLKAWMKGAYSDPVSTTGLIPGRQPTPAPPTPPPAPVPIPPSSGTCTDSCVYNQDCFSRGCDLGCGGAYCGGH